VDEKEAFIKIVERIKHDTGSFIIWCLISMGSLCIYSFVNHVDLTRFLVVLCFFSSLLMVWSYLYSCARQILKLLERKDN
jgi:hypothetical protein